MRILICTLLTAATLIAAPAAIAEGPPDRAPNVGYDRGPNVALKILDLALVRPIGVVVSVVSTTLYTAITPLTYPMGVSHDLFSRMVEFPWRFTSTRYYGNFSEYRDHKSAFGHEIQ